MKLLPLSSSWAFCTHCFISIELSIGVNKWDNGLVRRRHQYTPTAWHLLAGGAIRLAGSKAQKDAYLPGIIGVVTSPSGAVIRDILHRLADRFPRHVLVWPVLVQGEGAAEQVAAAIAFATVAYGHLNLIAPVVSMFFLISYGLLNYATFYEARAASPSVTSSISTLKSCSSPRSRQRALAWASASTFRTTDKRGSIWRDVVTRLQDPPPQLHFKGLENII